MIYFVNTLENERMWPSPRRSFWQQSINQTRKPPSALESVLFTSQLKLIRGHLPPVLSVSGPACHTNHKPYALRVQLVGWCIDLQDEFSKRHYQSYATLSWCGSICGRCFLQEVTHLSLRNLPVSVKVCTNMELPEFIGYTHT